MRLFSDQKKLLLLSYQSGGVKLGEDIANEAIASAYRRIGQMHSWAYLRRRTQVVTVAPQSTGTVTYTSATRTLTLTDATWPSWAQNGAVLMNSQIYGVDQYIDSTHITLLSDRSPAADLAAGTSYKIMQIEYVLPPNVSRIEEFVPIGQIWPMTEAPPGGMLELARLFYQPSRPWQYAFQGSSEYYGRMAIVFGPPPDAQYTFDVSFLAKPRDRTLAQPYTTGTISISGNAVTGTGTAFTSAMVGCRLRVGTVSNVPDGEFGAKGSITEYTIGRVTDATHLFLTETAVTATAVQFLIDDPIEIDRGSMDALFTRMCEHQFECLIHGDTRTEKESEVNREFERSRAADVRSKRSSTRFYVATFEGLAFSQLRYTP